MALRIGTSGWVYKHWSGSFYPEDIKASAWFSHYAKHFDTVEINNTFYRLPQEKTFDLWRERAPEGFLYAVKASRYLTHIKRLMHPEEPLERFFNGAGHLASSLGPVLYQLPPTFHINVPRLDAFLRALPAGYTHVLEFRHPSWFSEQVYTRMERFGVSHCIHDMRQMPVPLRVTSSPSYLRLHSGSLPGGCYEEPVLQAWAAVIREWLEQGIDVFVFFNNDFDACAIRDATTLKGMLGIS